MTYEKSRVAVDAVIFTIQNNNLKVFLNTREKEPSKGLLELPGGLLQDQETAEITLKRKLIETVGNYDIFFEQFNTFTKPDRDPRERTVSIGFLALVSSDKIVNAVHWHDIDTLSDLAFDHKQIIIKAREYLRMNLRSTIVKQFLPEHFPLNALQDVHEVIEDKQYDNRNFRKKMITSGMVIETDLRERNVSHRPAKLFKFKG